MTAPRNVGLANNNFPGRTGSPTTWDGTTFPFNYPVDLLTYGRERRERETDNTYLINQTDLVGKFITGIAEHQMSAGLEAARETRHQDRRDLCDSTNLACRTNAYNPDPNSSPIGGAIINYLPIETKAVDYAAYVSDQVKITKYFELLASLRYDYFSTDLQRSEPGAGDQPQSRAHRQSVQLSLRRGRPPDREVHHLRRLRQLL